MYLGSGFRFGVSVSGTGKDGVRSKFGIGNAIMGRPAQKQNPYIRQPNFEIEDDSIITCDVLYHCEQAAVLHTGVLK